MKVERWNGCYDSGWLAGDIVPDAFSHPAKMARGLVYRIVKTGLERGWWKPGDTLIDPFFGVGTTGIAGAAAGLNVIGVELEPRFVALAQANIDLHRREWERLGLPIPVVVQGDSRALKSLVEGMLLQDWCECEEESDTAHL